jgi:hypothetical protein
MWLGANVRTTTQKKHVQKRLEYVLEFVDHSRFKNQHNLKNLFDHLMSTRISIFDIEQDIHTSSKYYEESGDGQALDLIIMWH